jgi:hypothetical protein
MDTINDRRALSLIRKATRPARRPAGPQRGRGAAPISATMAKRYRGQIDKSAAKLKKLQRSQNKLERRFAAQGDVQKRLRDRLVDLDLEALDLRQENDVLRDTGRSHAQAAANAETELEGIKEENRALQAHLASLRARAQDLEKSIDANHQVIRMKAQTSMLIQQGRQEAETAAISAKTKQQVLAGESPTRKKTSIFNIAVKRGEQLKRAVAKVFQRYDTDGTGDIDVEELQEMIFDFQCTFPDLYADVEPMSPRRVARSVIEKLDRDQSGELDHSEFYNWLAAGVEMSHDQRQKFASKGPMKAQLTGFLNSVERYCVIMQNDDNENLQGVKDSIAAVRGIFDKSLSPKNENGKGGGDKRKASPVR